MVNMHVREPRDFVPIKAERQAKHRKSQAVKLARLFAILIVVLVVLMAGLYIRPLPEITAKTTTPNISSQQIAISWPTVGQSAVGLQGQGVLANSPTQTPAPTASVAKVMMALAVLKKQPLNPGQQGPSLTMTAADVARYNNYVAIGGSTVPVTEGETITEYQALQAALIPSANNMADSLAVWAYGSMDAYLTAANQLARGLGMTQSAFAVDASGFHPETVSTPKDLVLLGQAALDNPVIKQIVHQQSAVIPVAGEVLNTNVLLGKYGVIGIKTGNTDQAGGCYLFAADRTLPNGKSVTAIGAVMSAPTLTQAMATVPSLLRSFDAGFTEVTVLPKHTVVGSLVSGWGKKSEVVTNQDLKVLIWRGAKPSVAVKLQNQQSPLAAEQKVGTVTAQSAYGLATVSAHNVTEITKPSAWWRIVR